ncbi:probable esterase D14L [Phragmites australis]|uniref:probable esterase D14L n=1 Tax=Phragmites australis TaxID=29695 RepID=UPI002D77956A|nr:probable esterase D14L [Phragmites australis]
MRWYANVREAGHGDTTVVLAHGYGASQALWDKLVPALSHRNKVLLFDWDFAGGGGGAGQQEAGEGRYTFGRFADDLIALMDDKRVRGAVLVGHSMSAMAGCIASVRRPDLFSHLVLLCASPRYVNSEEESYVGGFDKAGIDGMLDAMSSDYDAWAKGFVPNAAGDPDCVPPLEKSFHAMRPAVALELARMIFLGDQREVLDAVTAPCTIVQVKADFVAPPSVAEYMRSRMKGAAVAVEIIDSVGHFPQLVAPQQLLDVLDGVLVRHGEDGHGVEQAADVEVDGGTDITA